MGLWGANSYLRQGSAEEPSRPGCDRDAFIDSTLVSICWGTD